MFDRQSVSVGDNFLYVAVNLGRSISIAIRLSIDELLGRDLLHFTYFVA